MPYAWTRGSAKTMKSKVFVYFGILAISPPFSLAMAELITGFSTPNTFLGAFSLGVSRIFGTSLNRASRIITPNASNPTSPGPMCVCRSTRLPRSFFESFRCKTLIAAMPTRMVRSYDCGPTSSNFSQPGIEAVSYAHTVPLDLSGQWWEPTEVQGYVPGPSENMKILRNVVAPGYFDVVKIPLVMGRDFTEHDDEKSARVIIVSETFARRFFHDRYPIGRRVNGWGRWFDVIGVAKDSKYESLTEAAKAYFYVPFRQCLREDMGIRLFVRTAAEGVGHAGNVVADHAVGQRACGQRRV